MNLYHFTQERINKRTPICGYRKSTFIKDEIENFKVYRIEQCILKNNISVKDFNLLQNSMPINTQKKIISSINLSIKENQKQLNSSCVCEECGGKIEKNRIIFQHLEQNKSLYIKSSQKFEKSPQSQQRQSVLDNSLLGSQQLLTERNLKSSIKKGARRSLKPVIKAIQAQNFMKKMADENNFNNRRSLQMLHQPELLYEKAQNKQKSQFRKSINFTPTQFRNRTEMSQYYFPILIKPQTLINQQVEIKQFSQTMQKSQPQILKSQKHNRTQSLQQRLELTYLKKQNSQPKLFKISQPKLKCLIK